MFLEEYIFFPEVQRGLILKSAGVFLTAFDDLTRFWNPVPSAAGREQGAVLSPVFIFLSWFPHSGPQNKWNCKEEKQVNKAHLFIPLGRWGLK